VPLRLERAWRAAPSLLRLRRWLGSVGAEARVRKAASQASRACPKGDECQRAVLHLALGDFDSAAKCLAAAPGLGWSHAEHPGHVVFDLLHGLLSGRVADVAAAEDALALRRLDLDEIEEMTADPDEPRVRAPELGEILARAGVEGPLQGESRAAVLAALRAAAEKRVAGVIGKRRRRHYGQAARLVATCAALERSPATSAWTERLRVKYSRYPALQRELDECLAES
jgi:hypothetical protein